MCTAGLVNNELVHHYEVAQRQAVASNASEQRALAANMRAKIDADKMRDELNTCEAWRQDAEERATQLAGRVATVTDERDAALQERDTAWQAHGVMEEALMEAEAINADQAVTLEEANEAMAAMVAASPSTSTTSFTTDTTSTASSTPRKTARYDPLGLLNTSPTKKIKTEAS